MSKLGVIVPTRSRPHNIEKVIDAWNITGAWSSADLIVVIDADDDVNLEYTRMLRDAPVTVMQIPKWTPMVPKLNAAAAVLATQGKYAALGFAGDDHLPRTPGWSTIYLDALAELGTGIVHGNDGYQRENLPTEWAMTVDIILALGRMVPAPVDHLYCDNSIQDLGRGADCLRYLSDVNIEHVNPYAGKVAMDAQYKSVNSRAQYSRDGTIYERWKRQQLQLDIKSVRKLKEA